MRLPLFLALPVRDYIEKLGYSTVFIGLALIAAGIVLQFMMRGSKKA